MKNLLAVLAGTLIVVIGVRADAHTALTTKDYDAFYTNVILAAKNGTKREWLAPYDAVVGLTARVRQDIEARPAAIQQAFARAVHNNGYWKGQEVRINDPKNPFLGAVLRGSEDQLKAVLTPQGFEAYRNRYAQGSRGYRLTLEIASDRAAFFRKGARGGKPTRFNRGMPEPRWARSAHSVRVL